MARICSAPTGEALAVGPVRMGHALNAPFIPSSQPHPSSPTKQYTVVSLFSGAGGMDLGFRGGFAVFNQYYPSHPFRVIWANDISPAACATYRRNLGDVVRCGDVWTLMDTLPPDADVLIGGFPCQDLSVNGKGAGLKGERSSLYKAMVEAVRRVRPRLFVAENVKGLLMRRNAEALAQIVADFESLGYRVSYSLYQAADYGVPQMRERVFVVGTSHGEGEFVSPLVRKRAEWMTAQEAIGDLEDKPADAIPNHVWSRANPSPEQGSRRLDPHKPGYTIRAECHGNIQFHYALPRRISMREAARLQSFPDDFVFEAKLRETERLVGNAVPPILAWHIADAVRRCLAGEDR